MTKLLLIDRHITEQIALQVLAYEHSNVDNLGVLHFCNLGLRGR